MIGRAKHYTYLRLTLVVVAAAAVWLAPAAAWAKRLDSDRIAGTSLSTCDPSHRIAPDVSAYSGVLCAPDGRVLWSRRATKAKAMASTTKVMTALLVLEHCDLDEVVTISKRASRVPYALGLREGESLTVRQLVELALVGSSNDAAIALAEYVGGSESRFVTLMNRRAQELGLSKTHFANAHGLDARGHHTSASDLSTLTQVASGLPEFRRVVALKRVTLGAFEERPTRTVKNTNELLGKYKGSLGGKTGFTDDAKYTLVSSAQRDGITLTAVIIGAPSNAKRFSTTKELLDWGFRHMRMTQLTTPTETVGTVPVDEHPEVQAPARFAEKIEAAVFDLEGPITREPQLVSSVPLPVFEGQPLGTVRLLQGERVVATATVVAGADVGSAGEPVGAVPVTDYIGRVVTARARESSVPVEPFDPMRRVQRDVRLDPGITAPVVPGEPLGSVVYSQDGKTVCTVVVEAAHAVERPGWLEQAGIWLLRRARTLVGAPCTAAPQVLGS